MKLNKSIAIQSYLLIFALINFNSALRIHHNDNILNTPTTKTNNPSLTQRDNSQNENNTPVDQANPNAFNRSKNNNLEKEDFGALAQVYKAEIISRIFVHEGPLSVILQKVGVLNKQIDTEYPRLINNLVYDVIKKVMKEPIKLEKLKELKSAFDNGIIAGFKTFNSIGRFTYDQEANTLHYKLNSDILGEPYNFDKNTPRKRISPITGPFGYYAGRGKFKLNPYNTQKNNNGSTKLPEVIGIIDPPNSDHQATSRSAQFSKNPPLNRLDQIKNTPIGTPNGNEEVIDIAAKRRT